MKERPILFNGPMVRAILDGHKTQTRRVVKPQPVVICGRDGKAFMSHNKGMCNPYDKSWTVVHRLTTNGHNIYTKSPYGKPGDRLWVRETFACTEQAGIHPADSDIVYRATEPEWGEEYIGWKWKPSIFMPRWASRILLEITDVRVELVQYITEEDARSEGCVPFTGCKNESHAYRWQFCKLWNSINAKRGYGWDTNPWVWVVEFKKLEDNNA